MHQVAARGVEIDGVGRHGQTGRAGRRRWLRKLSRAGFLTEGWCGNRKNCGEDTIKLARHFSPSLAHTRGVWHTLIIGIIYEPQPRINRVTTLGIAKQCHLTNERYYAPRDAPWRLATRKGILQGVEEAWRILVGASSGHSSASWPVFLRAAARRGPASQ